MNVNPLKKAREELGLSRHEVAIMAGTSIVAIYNAERGSLTRVPESVCAVFAGLGVDAERLQDAYKTWRMAEGRRVFIETRQGIGV